ncbi:hypothetical protein F4809DRAFT_625861 [Biscogniauxia mediterranea]|nr:hypothetical protein F4809DRAFT_625861 [Biscogniauxia mediterranea]
MHYMLKTSRLLYIAFIAIMTYMWPQLPAANNPFIFFLLISCHVISFFSPLYF